MADKYPARFADATHGLVLGAYEGDGWLFTRWCPIVRRPPGMVAIEGRTGATFTFTIESQRGKEFGHIGQANRPGIQAISFRVIPFNLVHRERA